MTAWEEKFKKLIAPTESKWPYRVVQIKPNRQNDDEIYTLSGREEDIAANGSLFLALYDLAQRSGGASKRPFSESSNKGLPIIKIYFEQDADKVRKRPNGKAYRPLRGEITIRIVDKSEDPESPLNKLTKGDVRQYAQKIKNVFGDNNGYLWQRGRKIVSYNKPEDGFKRTWYMCKTYTDGIDLLTKLTQIVDKPLDRRRIGKNEIDDENGRFAEKPPILVLGESVEQEDERAIGEVRFKSAELSLAKLSKPIQLVLYDKVLYD
jgi:hypothetical protein